MSVCSWTSSYSSQKAPRSLGGSRVVGTWKGGRSVAIFVPYTQGRVTDDSSLDDHSTVDCRTRASWSSRSSTSAKDSLEDESTAFRQVLVSDSMSSPSRAVALVNWFGHMQVQVTLAEPWDIHTVRDVKAAVASDVAKYLTHCPMPCAIPSLREDAFSLIHTGTVLCDDWTLYEAGVVCCGGVVLFQAVQGVVTRETPPDLSEWMDETELKVTYSSQRPCDDGTDSTHVEGLTIEHHVHGSVSWQGVCTLPLSLDVSTVVKFAHSGVDIAPHAPHGRIIVSLRNIRPADADVLRYQLAACQQAAFVSYSASDEEMRFIVGHGVTL